MQGVCIVTCGSTRKGLHERDGGDSATAARTLAHLGRRLPLSDAARARRRPGPATSRPRPLFTPAEASAQLDAGRRGARRRADPAPAAPDRRAPRPRRRAAVARGPRAAAGRARSSPARPRNDAAHASPLGRSGPFRRENRRPREFSSTRRAGLPDPLGREQRRRAQPGHDDRGSNVPDYVDLVAAADRRVVRRRERRPGLARARSRDGGAAATTGSTSTSPTSATIGWHCVFGYADAGRLVSPMPAGRRSSASPTWCSTTTTPSRSSSTRTRRSRSR